MPFSLSGVEAIQHLGLRHLPAHVDTLALSVAFFTILHSAVAPAVSRELVGKQKWAALRARARNGWKTHVVSFVHAIIVVPFAARCLNSPALDQDRAFGWDDRVGTVSAIASGYFIWDALDSLINFEGVGFVVHGVTCLFIYLYGLRPFLGYYGPRFLLWELSTPFLNIHWFIDKMGGTGSRLQLVNGAVLLATFASVRLVYGGIMSYRFWRTLYAVKDDIPPFLVLGYGVGNIVLQVLNWFWFTKMIAALRKRFRGKGAGAKVGGKENGNGKVA